VLLELWPPVVVVGVGVASLVLVFLIKATLEQLELPTVLMVKEKAAATEPVVVVAEVDNLVAPVAQSPMAITAVDLAKMAIV
jgi:hypothetical protein